MHTTLTEHPHAALSSRAALLSNLRTGGVGHAPTMGPTELPPLHLGQNDDQASLQHIQLAQAQAQAYAQAYAQNSPLLAQQLAMQQQQQQAELVRLLALQQQQQQLLLLQTLQAQAAQQAQAVQAQQAQAQTLQGQSLHPGYADTQRHSWSADTRRSSSPRFPSRPGSSANLAPRPVSSADLAATWRSGERSPPIPPSIVIDDGCTGEDMPARRVQRDGLPVRMPRGPPTDANELAANNFVARANTKVRRDAIKLLAAGRH